MRAHRFWWILTPSSGLMWKEQAPSSSRHGLDHSRWRRRLAPRSFICVWVKSTWGYLSSTLSIWSCIMFQTWLGENAPLWKSPTVSKHCLRDIVLRQLLVIMGRNMEWSGLSAGRGTALNLTPGNQLLIWGMHPLYWMSTSGCMACEWINQNTRH